MDPNEVLAQICALLKQIDDAETSGAHASLLREEALDSFKTLDLWLRFGGFIPDAWSRPPLPIAWH